MVTRVTRGNVPGLFLSLLLLGSAAGLGAQDSAPREVIAAVADLGSAPGTDRDLELVARLLADHRIVLLGENGHGVQEFSTFKRRLVEYLHGRHGFDILAFESGFHECRQAAPLLGDVPALRTLHDCLIVQLHHTEIERLLTYAAETRATDSPLRIAGIDLQVQGWSSRTRPALFRRALGATAPDLADSIAVLDSTLVELTFQSTDSVTAFVRRNGAFMRAAYDSGAAVTQGDTSWTFKAGSELVRREMHRAAATSFGLEPPSEVYAIRDFWMAETVTRLAEADSTSRIVVWLHNDHARYGSWRAGRYPIPSAGGILQDRFRDEVVSVGFLMGGGWQADNFRRPRPVPPPAQGSLESVMGLAGFSRGLLQIGPDARPEVRLWADRLHPYTRGSEIREMRPAREFDVLIWFDTVSAADYADGR